MFIVGIKEEWSRKGDFKEEEESLQKDLGTISDDLEEYFRSISENLQMIK